MILMPSHQLELEKEFLYDALNFYKDKRYTPELKTLDANYKKNRENLYFTEEDFLKNSGIIYNIANQIYLIGLAEYKTNLSFEQFLYYVFWNTEIWQHTRVKSKFSWRTRRNFNPNEYRKKLKFTQKGIAKKNKDTVKEDWKEYQKMHRDKKRAHYSRRSRWDRYDRSLFKIKKNNPDNE